MAKTTRQRLDQLAQAAGQHLFQAASRTCMARPGNGHLFDSACARCTQPATHELGRWYFCETHYRKAKTTLKLT